MISFCHYGPEKLASYRYRCQIPAKELGASINNPKADILIFAKPINQDIPYAKEARESERIVIVDYCDMHWRDPVYTELLRYAHQVTCPTEWYAAYLREEHGVEPVVVIDPYEFDEVEPHCNGDKLLWFGHGLNIDSLARIIPMINGESLAVVSNIDGTIPWSKETLLEEMSKADIVLMPETAPYKSANRTVEAVRRGCFVVAEPHPAINHIPGIWIGNIQKGIEWARQNPSEANQRTRLAQMFVAQNYSPEIQASAWRTAIQRAQSSLTLAAEIFTGTHG